MKGKGGEGRREMILEVSSCEGQHLWVRPRSRRRTLPLQVPWLLIDGRREAFRVSSAV